MKQNSKGFFLSILFFLIISLMLTGWVKPVQSQEKYPTRAINIIVPFNPGGTSDLLARLVGDSLSKKWGVPVNVMNKAGGGAIPATLEVYNSVPDGYTMMSDTNSSCTLQEIAFKELPFKVLDRTFIAMIMVQPYFFMTPIASPFKTLKDAATDAKENPGNFTWTSLGGSGGHDFAARQMFKGFGVDVNKTKPVICKGSAETVTLTAGGHVKLGISSPPGFLTIYKGGTARGLAITATAKGRLSDAPDVPTTAEAGYPTLTYVGWTGVVGPPKLPSHIVEKWDKSLREIFSDQEIISKLSKIGCDMNYLSGHEFHCPGL